MQYEYYKVVYLWGSGNGSFNFIAEAPVSIAVGNLLPEDHVVKRIKRLNNDAKRVMILTFCEICEDGYRTLINQIRNKNNGIN